MPSPPDDTVPTKSPTASSSEAASTTPSSPGHPTSDSPRPKVIGLLGGVASGKSFVARAFAAAGCAVIDADELVATVYQDPEVLRTLRDWWGPTVLRTDGTLDRKSVAARIFTHPPDRARLEALVHPRVEALRDARMTDAARTTPRPRAVVWDIPLLLETGADTLCDLLVFVDTPEQTRLERARLRGWDATELARREAAQRPLPEKRSRAHAVIDGTANAATLQAAAETLLVLHCSQPDT